MWLIIVAIVRPRLSLCRLDSRCCHLSMLQARRVYGVSCNGRKVSVGERISIEQPLTLLVGSGQYGMDDVSVVEPEVEMPEGGGDDVDEFVEVKE